MLFLWLPDVVRPQGESKHHWSVRLLPATNACIHAHSRNVLATSQDPCLRAVKIASSPDQCIENSPSDATTSVGWSNAYFVNEHLRRFIWMNVVHARRESHNARVIDRNDKMVPRIAEELFREARAEASIEHTWRDASKQRSVARRQKFDFNRHRTVPLSGSTSGIAINPSLVARKRLGRKDIALATFA